MTTRQQERQMFDRQNTVARKGGNLRSKLALSTALATIAFGYGGRNVYAGSCTGAFGIYNCSGATSVTGTDATATLFYGTALSATTVSGFGVDTSNSGGYGMQAQAGGITITDNFASSITGATAGIYAFNTAGSMTITTNGTTTGNAAGAFNGFGIRARNFLGTTDVAVDAGTVSGGHTGISVVNEGSGLARATATGTVSGGTNGIIAVNTSGTGTTYVGAGGQVTGSSGYGVNVSDNGFSNAMTVSTVGVTGGTYGISAVHNGISGGLSITSTGAVSGASNRGILASNLASSAAGVDISANAVSGFREGIYATHGGTGSLMVTANGQVTSTSDGVAYDGIHARTTGFSSYGMSVSATGVSAKGYGIYASHAGFGTLSVTSTGTVESRAGGKDGIRIRNTANSSSVNVSAAAVTAANTGIDVLHSGTGTTEVSASGLVTAMSGRGLFVRSSSTSGKVTISATDVNAGGAGIEATQSGFGALSITATGTVTAAGNGITAVHDGAGGSVIAVQAADVTGSNEGILAFNRGAGFTTVTSTGTVTGLGSRGIYAISTDANAIFTTVNANNVSGNLNGIKVIHASTGTGTVNINVSGAVTSNLAAAIDARSGTGGNSNITLNSGASVSTSGFTAIFNDGGNSTTTVNAGASVTGAFELGDGDDALSFNGGDFSGVTFMTFGTGTDSLNFLNTSGNLTAGNITGIESTTVGLGAAINIAGTLASQQVTVEAGGTLSAGASPGLLEILGDADFLGGSTLLVELGGLLFGTEYDRVDVADDPATTGTVEGTATLADGTIFDIDWFGGFTALAGNSFDVLVADDIVFTSLASLVFDFTGAVLGAGLSWQTSLETVAGGREALRLTVVSEESFALNTPSSATFVLAGFLGLAGIRRRYLRRG